MHDTEMEKADDLDSFLDEIEAQEMALGVKIDELNEHSAKIKRLGVGAHEERHESLLGDGRNMNEEMNKDIDERVAQELYYHKENVPHPMHVLEEKSKVV